MIFFSNSSYRDRSLCAVDLLWLHNYMWDGLMKRNDQEISFEWNSRTHDHRWSLPFAVVRRTTSAPQMYTQLSFHFVGIHSSQSVRYHRGDRIYCSLASLLRDAYLMCGAFPSNWNSTQVHWMLISRRKLTRSRCNLRENLLRDIPYREWCFVIKNDSY